MPVNKANFEIKSEISDFFRHFYVLSQMVLSKVLKLQKIRGEHNCAKFSIVKKCVNYFAA